jgi:hypothetical protein
MCWFDGCSEAFGSAGALGRHSSAIHGVMSGYKRRRLAKEAAAARAAAARQGGNAGATRPGTNGAAPSGPEVIDDANGGGGVVTTPRVQRDDSKMPVGGRDAYKQHNNDGGNDGGGGQPPPDRLPRRPSTDPAAAAAVRAPGLARMMLHPAEARWALLVYRLNISARTADVLLRYFHEHGLSDLAFLPQRMRTVNQQVREYRALALAAAVDAADEQPDLAFVRDWMNDSDCDAGDDDNDVASDIAAGL